MNDTSPRGRRPGSPDTRAAILDAARRRFLAEGYHAVTLRSIAVEAAVDPALISYYFGSKKGLFGAALALAVNPADVLATILAGDPATFPQRALRGLLAVWDGPDTGPTLLAMFKNAVQDDTVAALVREAVEREIVDRIAARIGGTGARQRAAAFCSQMAGIIATRYLLRLEPVASMTPDEVVRHLGPPLRRALEGPASRPSARPAAAGDRRRARPGS
ncbi:TetR family transcriptional regulator [Kitasatospora sp. NPDC048540]|uniref:TetR/AcrR family transcriptional regulator n=1 Tax=unclassified Kitasatospora TaxID=2633591 RepID=UPI00053B10C7|nr:TetR family transcriptional regulator [Kitasatospora sp. MBT63]